MKAHSSGVSDYCLCAMMKFIILTEKLRGCFFTQAIEEMLEAGGGELKRQLKPLIPFFLPSRCYKYSVYITMRAFLCYCDHVARQKEINDSGSRSIYGRTAYRAHNSTIKFSYSYSIEVLFCYCGAHSVGKISLIYKTIGMFLVQHLHNDQNALATLP